MKSLALLLLLATLVSCAGPTPQPVGDVAVAQPGVACRANRDGGPVLAERGIGGTGAPGNLRVTERGIGGTGIVGVVTGFASICIDGLEVRYDNKVAVSINGAAAGPAQLRVGQLVAIKATSRSANVPPQAQTIGVRYEVSGPIEAIDSGNGAMTVAGQHVAVLSSTWVAGRFALGTWTIVSGLRQMDGTIVASRLDRARVGALAVRGQITRDHDITSIGNLVLHGPAVADAMTGTFVFVVGRYVDMSAEVAKVAADPLLDDPVSYFGPSADRLVLQGFVRVDRGTVTLASGQTFPAGADVRGTTSDYRNAIIRLTRASDGRLIATELRYTNYLPQPKEASVRMRGNRAANLVLPPQAPPGPPADSKPADPADNGIDGSPAPAAAPMSDPDPEPSVPARDTPPGDTPSGNAASGNAALSAARHSGGQNSRSRPVAFVHGT